MKRTGLIVSRVSHALHSRFRDVSRSIHLPSGDFATTPQEGWAPLDIAFDDSGSSDPDYEVIKRDWDFGDDSTSVWLRIRKRVVSSFGKKESV